MARCPEPCGKVIFTSEWIAELACIRIAMEGDWRSWYRARECGCWHLTKGRAAAGGRARAIRRYLPGEGGDTTELGAAA